MSEEQRKTSIASISFLNRSPSVGYCRTCSSSAIKCAEIFTQINALRLEEELCDIVVSIKSSSFNMPVHRLILATKSPFFKRYFTENKNATEFEFDEGFSADGVKSVLEYIYESELVVSSENVEDLTKIAVLLEVGWTALVFLLCTKMSVQSPGKKESKEEKIKELSLH